MNLATKNLEQFNRASILIHFGDFGGWDISIQRVVWKGPPFWGESTSLMATIRIPTAPACLNESLARNRQIAAVLYKHRYTGYTMLYMLGYPHVFTPPIKNIKKTTFHVQKCNHIWTSAHFEDLKTFPRTFRVHLQKTIPCSFVSKIQPNIWSNWSI